MKIDPSKVLWRLFLVVIALVLAWLVSSCSNPAPAKFSAPLARRAFAIATNTSAPMPPAPLAAQAPTRINTFTAAVRCHYWLCVQSGTNWVPFETNFDWSPPLIWIYDVGGTNRQVDSVTLAWNPFPANLFTNTGPVTEPYDLYWTLNSKSNFMAEILTTNCTAVIVPPVTNRWVNTYTNGVLLFSGSLSGPWIQTNNPLFVTNSGPPYIRGRSTNGLRGVVTRAKL